MRNTPMSAILTRGGRRSSASAASIRLPLSAMSLSAASNRGLRAAPSVDGRKRMRRSARKMAPLLSGDWL